MTMRPSDHKAIVAAELSNRLFFRLYQCANMMHKTGTRVLVDYRVTTQQWAVLGALSRHSVVNGMTVGELARFLMVSRQNLAGVLTRLETLNYIERVRDHADGRSRRIRLTDDGRVLWEHEITPKIFDYYDQALANFSIDDRVETLHYLNKLLNNLKTLEEGNGS